MLAGKARNSLWLMPWIVLWLDLTLWPITGAVEAHEGHQPLPTQGVQVDVERGQLVLSAKARAALGVETEEVQVGDVGRSLLAYAEIVAPWQAQAFGSAQISGRITRLLVRPGDVVTKGQEVAELTSRELESVRLSYLQAKNDLELNRNLLDSTRPAAREGAVPLQRLEELENALKQSENDLEIAKIRAATLGLDAQRFDESDQAVYHLIRSPIAGKVVHSDLSEGKFVEAFEHLFEIVNPDETWAKIQVLEKDFQQLDVGQKVQLTLRDSSQPIETTIDRLDVTLDPQAKVGWAWATVSHLSALPGQVGTAKVQITLQTNRLTVPLDSVYSDGLQSYVFVEEASTRRVSEYQKRNVKLGERTTSSTSLARTRIEILQGDIFPGDRVVIKGGHELSSLFFLGVLKLNSEDRQRLGIRTTQADERSIASTLELAAVATLPPEARWTVSSQLPGTIQSHNLSPGKKVRSGDLLMEIASPEFQSLQLELLRATLDAELVRQRADRLQQAGRDVFARRLLLELLNRADQLQLKADSLKRQLASLGLLPTEIDDITRKRQVQPFLPLRSAMDGYIAKWRGTLGETVSANQSLAEIQRIQNVWIEAQLPSSDKSPVSIDDTALVSVLSNPSVVFPATVSRVGPVISPNTRTQQIWLDPKVHPERFLLRDGVQLSVLLKRQDSRPALAVPREAILRDGLHAFVFVQKPDDYVERRRIVVGRSDGQWSEVLQGLEAGDEVIVAGGRELQTAFASLR